MKDVVKSIVRYNPKRQYFGVWTPQELQDVYASCKKREDLRTAYIATGKISLVDVCNTLWNEMSYNPLRFGTQSPFVVNGVLNIDKSLEYYKKQTPESEVMIEVCAFLKSFIKLLNKHDLEFNRTGVTECSGLHIGRTEYESYSNIEYKILANLVHCIHKISSQNNKDAELVKYCESMWQVITKRHPDMTRSLKRQIFVTAPQIKQTKQDKIEQGIRFAIEKKQADICNTEMHIKDLSELEAPVDLSKYKSQLAKQEQEKAKLEESLRRYMESQRI